MRTAMLTLVLVLATAHTAVAAVPALRDQVSLNGIWPEGGEVPTYVGISGLTSRTYERSVTVPSAWSGRIVKVEFGAVNFIADVYVNGQHVANHVGGWNPFAVDVTSRVAAGSSFQLRVVVRGPRNAPIMAADGKFRWPIGAWSNRGGIADDVWLRAYGKVHVEDSYIRTSWRAKTLEMRWTVRNGDSRSRTVSVRGAAARPGGATECSLASASVTLAAGERRVVTATVPWANATPYWPDAPALYHLASTVVEGTTTVDRETRRFGFREIWIDGNQYRWNGVRINLYGDYQSLGDTWYPTGTGHPPAAWPTTVDRIKAMNIRCVRFHHEPPPAYILDVADEKGLLICDESPNYGREHLMGTDQAAYIANTKTWIGPWIRSHRNHPSVYIWSATNEMSYPHLGAFPTWMLRELGDVIRQHDDTRPVCYDGDDKVTDTTLNYHYPEYYNRQPTGSIYGWASKVSATRPTGSGELLHAKSGDPAVQYDMERNKWWLGIWTRGLRATNWTDVRPACYWFAYEDTQSADPKRRVRGENLRNAYNPVALFDRAYDDLGISPYVNGTTPGGTLPTLDEGANLTRTLILYNDEFRDTAVSVEVQVRSGATVHASTTRSFQVALGSRVEFPITFQVPNVGGAELQLVLITRKGGAKRFEEARRFTVRDVGRSGPTSAAVIITAGTPTGPTTPTVPNQAPSVSLSSPAAGTTVAAGTAVAFAATAADADGTVARVEFFRNGTWFATDASAPYQATWTASGSGAHAFTAKAIDDDGASTISAPVTVTVGGGSTFSAKINFQPAAVAVPAGHLVDCGETYGLRANSRTYGWNAATPDTRDRDLAGDQRFDTLIHLQKPANPNARWEIAVPNGTYDVTVMSGDAKHIDSVYRTSVEGTLAVSATPTTANRWHSGTVRVTVTDGRLTVGNAAGAANNKICFIEITGVPAGSG